MVKRELTIHEFEAIKSSLAGSISRRAETGGGAEPGTGPDDAAVEQKLLELLGEGTLFIETDE